MNDFISIYRFFYCFYQNFCLWRMSSSLNMFSFCVFVAERHFKFELADTWFYPYLNYLENRKFKQAHQDPDLRQECSKSVCILIAVGLAQWLMFGFSPVCGPHSIPGVGVLSSLQYVAPIRSPASARETVTRLGGCFSFHAYFFSPYDYRNISICANKRNIW